MTKLDIIPDKANFSELITRVKDNGERIAISQQGNPVAALITYADLKRFEALEALLPSKAYLDIICQLSVEEIAVLIAAIEERVETVKMMQLAETGFDEWHDPEEDIYNEQA
jgi:prevent-host-death family protein